MPGIWRAETELILPALFGDNHPPIAVRWVKATRAELSGDQRDKGSMFQNTENPDQMRGTPQPDFPA